jgi:protein required for attachment to host cells
MHAAFTLVLLAADHDIRLLRNEGVGKGLIEILHQTRADLPEVDFEFSDQPVRTAGHGQTSHSAEPRQTAHEKERGRMAKHAIARLHAEWAQGGYSRVIISAPDKMLHLLRKGPPKEMVPHLTADLDKDIVGVALADLPAHFDGVAVF